MTYSIPQFVRLQIGEIVDELIGASSAVTPGAAKDRLIDLFNAAPTHLEVQGLQNCVLGLQLSCLDVLNQLGSGYAFPLSTFERHGIHSELARGTLRLLRQLGMVEYCRGLWSEDNDAPAGSGYSITAEGTAFLSKNADQLANAQSRLSQDTVNLVIAARETLDAEGSADALRALDKAVEAFASRVRYADEPAAEALT